MTGPIVGDEHQTPTRAEHPPQLAEQGDTWLNVPHAESESMRRIGQDAVERLVRERP